MKPEQHPVCLLLGSNIEPEINIPAAIRLLSGLLELLRFSSVWQTSAVGSAGPDFLNVALLALTSLDAAALKEQVIHPVEAQLGRVRTTDKNAPRTIDIDLIFFDGRQVDSILWQYAFRAVPVAEVLPEVRSEAGVLLKDVASHLPGFPGLRLRTDVVLPPATSPATGAELRKEMRDDGTHAAG